MGYFSVLENFTSNFRSLIERMLEMIMDPFTYKA